MEGDGPNRLWISDRGALSLSSQSYIFQATQVGRAFDGIVPLHNGRITVLCFTMTIMSCFFVPFSVDDWSPGMVCKTTQAGRHAEEFSKSRNKFHQTTCKPFAGPQYFVYAPASTNAPW